MSLQTFIYASRGDVKMLEQRLKPQPSSTTKPEQVDAPTPFQRTHLHWAAISGHTAACQLLLQLGANVNACDEVHPLSCL
jgi:hypothetical protein